MSGSPPEENQASLLCGDERGFPDPLDVKFQNNGPERVNESETHVLSFSSKYTLALKIKGKGRLWQHAFLVFSNPLVSENLSEGFAKPQTSSGSPILSKSTSYSFKVKYHKTPMNQISGYIEFSFVWDYAGWGVGGRAPSTRPTTLALVTLELLGFRPTPLCGFWGLDVGTDVTPPGHSAAHPALGRLLCPPAQWPFSCYNCLKARV